MFVSLVALCLMLRYLVDDLDFLILCLDFGFVVFVTLLFTCLVLCFF